MNLTLRSIESIPQTLLQSFYIERLDLCSYSERLTIENTEIHWCKNENTPMKQKL